MAQIKITDLTEATIISDNTVLIVDDGNETKKVGKGNLLKEVKETHSKVLLFAADSWDSTNQQVVSLSQAEMGDMSKASIVYVTVPEDITLAELKNNSNIILTSVTNDGLNNSLSFTSLQAPKGTTRIKVVSVGG